MPVVHYEIEKNVAIIRMDDGKANALSDAMLDELDEALSRAEKEAGAVVLTGRPDKFCAGFDLRVMMSSPEAARTLLRKGAAVLMRLYGLPLPLVVASTGHALAGGALVLLTADIRVGAEGAYRIGLNEVTIGMPLPVLAIALAKDRLALSELAKATLTAQIYDPAGAVHAGYLDEVVSAGECLARAKAIAEPLAGLSRMAFSGSKRRMRGATIEHVLGTLEADMQAVAEGR